MTIFSVYKRVIAAYSLTCLMLFSLSKSGLVVGAEPDDRSAPAREDAVQCTSCDDGLTGDWGGHRRVLAQRGLQISLENVGDMFSIRQGDSHDITYTNLFSAAFSFDMERLANVSGGSAYLWIVDTAGDNPADVIGSIHAPSNIAAASAVRLLEAWYEQSASDDRLGVLVGFYAVDSEFDFKATADIFINGSFGTGLELSESGLNGPSIFPVTSFGTRVRYDFSENVKARLAVLDGVPGEPDDPTATAVFDFSQSQGIFAIGELDWVNTPGDPFRRIGLGAWHYTTTFDDVLDTQPDGEPVQRKGSSGFYGFVESMLVEEEGNPGQGLAGLVRVGVADQNVQQVAAYYGAGLVYRGLFPGRDEDSIGFGFSTAVNGDKFKQAQAQAGEPVTDSETEWVMVYAAKVNRWLRLQPVMQYIVHPGTNPKSNNAFLLGLRFSVTL